MRILLVVPPYRTADAIINRLFPMPLGLASIAAVLSDAGHEVEIRDFLIPQQTHRTAQPLCFRGKRAPAYLHYGQPMDECFRWLDANLDRFDAVGLASCQCPIFETVEILSAKIRQRKPLVVGGPFATTAPDESVRRFKPNVLVRYEAEPVVDEAFERAAAGESGVILDGSPVDLASLPLPRWDLSPPKLYPKHGSRIRCVLSVSRGCPWSCEFCSVFTVMSRKYRSLPRDAIVDQLKHLWSLGVSYFCFVDDNLFLSRDRVDAVLGAIDDCCRSISKFKTRARFYMEEGMEVRIAAEPGVVKRAHDAGFEFLSLGVETINAANLTDQNKPYSPEQMSAAVAECRRANVPARAFYIIGFPDDTVESVARDLVEFAGFGMDVRTNNLKLYPGTGTTKRFIAAGLIDRNFDWRLSTFYTPPTGSIAYDQIKRLKTYLAAFGKSGSMGVNVVLDSIDDVAAAMAANRYSLRVRPNGVVSISGNMFRPTEWLRLSEIIAYRCGAMGASACQEGKTMVVAYPLDGPRDRFQKAIRDAMANAGAPGVVDG